MPEPVRTRCPKCQATLTLKSAVAVGKTVPCPRCKAPFVVRAVKDQPTGDDAVDELGPLDDAAADAEFKAAAPPPVVGRGKKAARRRAKSGERVETRRGRSPVLSVLSVLIWINAHIAVAVCIVDNAIDFVWLLAHWNEVYQQSGLGRIAVRQLGRPLFVIFTAGLIWFQGVLFRDIMARGAVVLFGGAYLLLFGAVALVVGMLAKSIYDRPIYAIQWSVIYLGASLLAYAAWGYAPETSLQRAERLTSQGRYSEALTAVEKAMQEDPDDREALELHRSLREMIRYA